MLRPSSVDTKTIYNVATYVYLVYYRWWDRMFVLVSLSTVSCGPSHSCCRTNLLPVVLSFCAVVESATAVYGVLEKFVDYLFLFFCLTRTLSPLVPLYFVARRSFAYRFPTYFAFFSFGLLYIGGINLLWKGGPLSDVTLCPDGRGP